MSNLADNMLSARAIAAEVRGGRLSAGDALALGEQRTDSHENNLNVFTARPAYLDPRSGALSGIAVGVKDIFDTRDLPTQYGSSIYKDHQPVADAALVSMLKKAGATIAGKTVTTEFAWFQPGPTRNPNNTDHTPGGSSSGSAAGVAAGFFPAAIGSQTGGSIIRPASFCGVSGYKPSFRLFPTIGMKHYSWSLDTVGFFAATAADNSFVASVCSDRDLLIDETETSTPRIGIFRSNADHALSTDMQQALETTIESCRNHGATIIDIACDPTIEAAHSAHRIIQDFESYFALADERLHHNDLFSEKLRNNLEAAAAISPEQYDDARRTANRARKASAKLFADCDVLLTPSAPGAAPKGLASTGDPIFNRLWTLLGTPTINVAGHKNQQGLPLGMQIIAPFGQDKRGFQVAHWLEYVLREI